MLDQDDYLNRAIGAGVGYATYNGAQKMTKKYVRQPYAKVVMKPLKHGFNSSEKGTIKNAVLQAFDGIGLKNRGVVLNNVTTENVQKINTEFNKKIVQIIENMLHKLGYSEKMITLQKATVDRIMKKDKNIFKALQIAADGENAFYHPFSKTININLNKMPAAAFHEMGHALNNTDKYTRILAYGRHPLAMLVPPLILAVGLLKNKKQEGEAPKDNLDKTGDFIKNNAGKLTFAALVPTIAEEGLASVRGSKMAKPLLSKELLKKFNNCHLRALSTYVLGATMVALSVRLAIAVRDAIMTNKNKEAQV